MSYRHSAFYLANASVLEPSAASSGVASSATASSMFDKHFHNDLVRCATNAYTYIAAEVDPSVVEYKNDAVVDVNMNTTGVLDNMCREHSRGTCSCNYHVFVGRGCWVDGEWYSCYYQYLSENGHSCYYTKVEESSVSEVVELSPDCYRFSQHPISFEPRECSACGVLYCACNLTITHLTVTCNSNDLFVF